MGCHLCLGWEDPLEEEMATHSSILAWRIPWTEELGGLQSTGLQRAGHDLATEHSHSHTQVVRDGTRSGRHRGWDTSLGSRLVLRGGENWGLFGRKRPASWTVGPHVVLLCPAVCAQNWRKHAWSPAPVLFWGVITAVLSGPRPLPDRGPQAGSSPQPVGVCRVSALPHLSQ